MQIKKILFIVILALTSHNLTAQTIFQTSFAKDSWNSSDWIMVKSPRWDYVGKWIQRDNFIENKIPDSTGSKEHSISYTSMVLKKKFSGEITVKAKMEFADRMAPLIVIAPELGKDKHGYPEYREHYEIVLWDKGVNIWHHYFSDGKPSWKLVAFERIPIKPNTQYELMVKFYNRNKDKMLSVSVDGQEFGYMDNSLPNEFYIGITGCEGINRFYSFIITK